MFWFSLVTLGMAIAAFHFSHTLDDDVMQLAALLSSIFCLLISFIVTPWTIKLLTLLSLLALLNHIQGHKPVYPRRRFYDDYIN